MGDCSSNSYDLFTTIVDMLPFGVYVVDTGSHELLYVNRHYQERLDKARDNRCWKALFQQEQPCLNCNIPKLNNSVDAGNQAIAYDKFDEVDERWYHFQEQCLNLPDGRRIMYSMAVDISQLKGIQNSLAEAHAQLALKNQELQRLSTTDQLTGLYNRLRLDGALLAENTRAQRYGTPYSLIIMDLDHFKTVNDTHGHQAGDMVLVNFAKILTAASRQTDIVGRWGGEEFLLICPQTDLNGALAHAGKLCATIGTAPFPVVGRQTASMGVAAWRPGDDEEALLKRADEALYRAKEAGRNRVMAEALPADQPSGEAGP